MSREKSIACYMNMITTSSSNNTSDDHESLDADQEYAPKR
jgi:hypothetical protein